MLNTFTSFSVNSEQSVPSGKSASGGKSIINKITRTLISLVFLLIVQLVPTPRDCTFNIENCLSQTQFQWTIGGTSNDYGYSIVRTTDGGYALAGYTNSFGAGSSDFYIVKLDGSGTLQWSRTVGGTGNDFARSIIQTTDGGYAVAGSTLSFGAGGQDYDFYIVKLDASGTLQWTGTVGGTNVDAAYSIIQTTDGGIAAIGYTYLGGFQDPYIVKFNSNGTLQWTRTVGGTATDYGYSMVQTTDGGYALAGATSVGAGSYDFYIVKLDAGGSVQWSKTIGGTSYEYPYSIIQTTDGGYALAGYTNSFGAGEDMYIVKFDASGTLQWSRTIGGTGVDRANSIIQTTDGSYAVAGYTNSFGAGLNDFYIVKLDSGGTLQWSRTIGGTGFDEANSIIQTTDGGYAVAGNTLSFGTGLRDFYIAKLDASGNTCGNSTSPTSISGTGGTTTSPTTTVISPTPIVRTPPSSSGTGGTVTVICTLVGIQQVSNEKPVEFSLSQNYPNPFNPSTKIRFSIPANGKGQMADVKLIVFDILGREVATIINEQLKPGTYKVEWNGSNFTSGVYFYKLITEEFSETKRMMLLK